jgi:hypothetical protein
MSCYLQKIFRYLVFPPPSSSALLYHVISSRTNITPVLLANEDSPSKGSLSLGQEFVKSLGPSSSPPWGHSSIRHHPTPPPLLTTSRVETISKSMLTSSAPVS